MRNKKELHTASCIDELNNHTKLPKNIKKSNLTMYVWFNNKQYWLPPFNNYKS